MEENVRIVITGDNKDALKKVNQVEKAVGDLNRVSQQVEIGVKGINKVEKEVGRLYNALEKLESAALSKLPRSVQVVIAYLKAATQSAGELGGRFAFAAAESAKIAAPLKIVEENVKSVNQRLLVTFSMFQRLSQLQSELRQRALPPGVQGGELATISPRFGRGRYSGTTGFNDPRDRRGGPLALRPEVFNFDPTTIRGLREGADHLRDLMETARIGSPEFRRYEEGLTRLNNAIRDAQLKGQKSGIGTPANTGSIAALRQQAEALTASLEQAEIGSKRFRELERSLFKVNKQIRRTEDNVRGTTGRNLLGAAAIGGAFPLLFGQGPGAAIGGAVGEMFGPMGGIVGTAVGAPFDQLTSAAAALGQALNPLTADFEAVIAAAGEASTAFSKSVSELEKAGLSNAALEIATQKLATVVGGEGVNSLKQFGDDTTRLTQAFSRFISNVQAGLARLINDSRILSAVTRTLDNNALVQQASRSKDPIVSEAFKEYEETRSRGGAGLATRKEVLQARFKVIALQRKLNAEEALNVDNLLKATLAQKKNLDLAKAQLSAQQKLASIDATTTNFLEKQLEAQRAQRDFDERRAEIVENYEKSIANLRRNVENQISTLRLDNLRRANQLEDQRAANALSALRNQQRLSQIQTQGTGAGNPLLAREAQILRDAADTYAFKTAEAQEKRAKLERDSALTVEEIQFRTDKFKLDVARQAAELQINAQKQVDRINKNIIDRNAKFNEDRFNVEKILAQLRLDVLQKEVAFEVQKLNDQLRPESGLSVEQSDAVRAQQRQLSELSQGLAEEAVRLKAVQAPGQLGQVADVAQATVDLSGYNRLAAQRLELETSIVDAQTRGIQIQEESNLLERLSSTADLLRQVEIQEGTLAAQRQQAQEKELRVAELTRQLGSRSRAEEIAGIEAAARLQKGRLDLYQEDLEILQATIQAKVENNTATETEVKNLTTIAELLERINAARGTVDRNSVAAQKQAKGEIQQFIEQATAELNNFEAMAVRVSQGIGDAIGNSLNNGISRLIEGSATVKEVFADMLKSVGQILVQEGTKMIATYIAIGIAKAFAGMGSKFETAPLGEGFTTGATPSSFDAVGAGLFTPRANGGPVRGGQPYMVGERGPELFVPGTNGGIMRNDDMRQMMGRSPVGNTPQMNFTFETTSIGGQEFVSREQLEAAMATTRRQAANDGAKRGMNMTLDKMQNSPRTRSRVGIR